MKEKDNDPLFQDLQAIIDQGKRQVSAQ